MSLSPRVAIIMGSTSDLETMSHAAHVLDALDVAYDMRVVSAHRTPDRLYDFAKTAETQGFKVIIAGAGGAAHLPGMAAALTPLPVIGVPVKSRFMDGLDSVLSILQMPGGVPVATMSAGTHGAKNAGLFAASILALGDTTVAQALKDWRQRQTDSVPDAPRVGSS